MPGLTVILPALNAMPYLPEALASLESQTFRDFEVILWDNGSTDGTVEEAKRWIPERLPGRVVSDQPLPLHLCLARMVEEANSTYIARMDADDIALPDRFRSQVSFLDCNAQIALVGAQIRCIDDKGHLLQSEEWANYALDHSSIVTRMMVWGPFNHPSIMFRRAEVLKTGNYSCPAPIEDHDLYLRLVLSHRVANLSSVCTHYRTHSSSICASAKEDNRHGRLVTQKTIEAAKAVFGLNHSVMALLIEGRHPFCLAPLFRSARYRSSREDTSFMAIILSEHFNLTARYLLCEDDLLSRLLLRLMSGLKALLRLTAAKIH